jgi:hypothetical protein
MPPTDKLAGFVVLTASGPKISLIGVTVTNVLQVCARLGNAAHAIRSSKPAICHAIFRNLLSRIFGWTLLTEFLPIDIKVAEATKRGNLLSMFVHSCAGWGCSPKRTNALPNKLVRLQPANTSH